MHCEVNFPGTKQQSDLDVPLPVGMEDDAYLQTLAKVQIYCQMSNQIWCCTMLALTPWGDRLGKLALTDTGIFAGNAGLSTCVVVDIQLPV